MLTEAGDLKAVWGWLRHIHSKLSHKISKKDVQEMTVRDYLDRHGGMEEYEAMKPVWEDYLGRNFARECQDVYLEKLGLESTRVAVFCLSENSQERGYATWLFVNYLMDAHNSFFRLLKGGKPSKLLDIHLPDKSKRLVEMGGRNFFNRLALHD